MEQTKPQHVEPVLVSKREACRLLGDICMRSLEYLIRDKKIRAKKISTRRVGIPYQDIVNFAKR